MLNKFIIFFIALSLIITSQAYEFNLPLDKSYTDGPRDEDSEPVYASFGAGDRVESNMVDPISINNYILPAKKQGHATGDRARIYLEIKNNKKNPTFKNISAIGVREIVDDDLGILPHTARWKMTASIDEISSVKLDLFRENEDLSHNLEEYSNCYFEKNYYKIIDTKNLDNLDPNEKDRIIELLSDYFDVIWINEEGLDFNRSTDRKIFINDSKNNWANISINDSESIKLALSDGRSYDLEIKSFNGSNYICDTNSILRFDVKDLHPKGSIIFFYDIRPKKSGTFNKETIIRLYDSNYGHFQDLNFVVPIEIRESLPKFEVNPKPNKLASISRIPFRSKPDRIDISYDINYLGGGSEPTCSGVYIEFDKPEEGQFYYVNETDVRNDNLYNVSSFPDDYSSFDKYETKKILMRVVYPNEGSFSIPGIWINGVHYPFENEKVTVESFYSKNMQYIFLLIAIFSLLISSIEVYLTREAIGGMKQVPRAIGGNKQKPSLRAFLKHFAYYIIALFIFTIILIYLLSRPP